MEASHKYLSKSSVFHPKASSLLKSELLKEHMDYSQHIKKTSDHMGRNQKAMELITSTMTPSTNITSSIVKHAIDTTASSSSSMLPTATVNSQIQSSGVICNGTAISPKSMTVSSSNNHVSNSKLAE